MTTFALNQTNSFTEGLAHWLVSKGKEPSFVSKVNYHLAGRIALAGASLLLLVESIGRAVMAGMGFMGYFVTAGHWQQAESFGITQVQKGGAAGSVSLSCFFSIISPKELINYLKGVRPNDDHMRSWKIERRVEVVEGKLQNQFEHAQNQAANESDKAFNYLPAPASFQGEAHTEQVPGHEVGVCHYIGRRPTMEDEHLTTSFNLTIGHKAYPVTVFGVFDGHGGSEASGYVKENLERQLHQTLNEFCSKGLTDEAIWSALKITFTKLKTKFKEPHSGTTATVAMVLEGKLWTANVGDSRTILDNGIQLSEDAKPVDSRYKKGIENRGGNVFFNRVNGCLAVARAVGDHSVGAISARPKITAYPLSRIPKGSHLILTCDGIYDVASTRQVAAAVRDHKNQSAVELAKNIVYSAYQANSGDNLTALVVKF